MSPAEPLEPAAPLEPAEPRVLRAPMRSRDDAVDHAAAVRRALAQGVCGTGGRLSREPVDLPDALGLVEEEHDQRVAARLRRFAEEADGTWPGPATPTAAGGEACSTVAGATTPARRRTASAWLEVADPDVPPAVRSSFARGGRNLQRIHDR
ncbi:GAF domain-containing protein [Nocardioides sp. SOB44]|uniref:GAF domain-containing protein n=1 Tax=Nocardioides cremeus TaxID=3058044 RepID=A0ABT8TZK3_9ACTN|nr:GAF domain-containing protein [Nocardioides cremeus]MDO3397772.1 GAF domain-containing protein [Nocardioides cremeus]